LATPGDISLRAAIFVLYYAMTDSILKTGSWFSVIPDDHSKIGISRGVPRRGVGPGYRLYKRLAPGPWFHSVDLDEYRNRYQTEVLDQLDPVRVRDDLLRLADGRIAVLCCFEKVGPGMWCHRAMAAQWLAQALEISVPEIGQENLPIDCRPLLPQVSLL
jgi:hypothetical protein